MSAKPSTEMFSLPVPVLPNPLGWRVYREVANGKPSQGPTIYAVVLVKFLAYRRSIWEKNFRPGVWLARPLGRSGSKRATGFESGENFDLMLAGGLT